MGPRSTLFIISSASNRGIRISRGLRFYLDSRLRGNDAAGDVYVIPAKAGIQYMSKNFFRGPFKKVHNNFVLQVRINNLKIDKFEEEI